MHVPRDERSKLDSKTRQCIFIGYGHEEFGTDFGIWSTRKLSEAEMQSSLKIRPLQILRSQKSQSLAMKN